MSNKEKYVYVPRFFSPYSQITEIMNEKLDSRSEKKLRKLKISRALFGLADRKSPEIPQNLSRKRKLQDGEKSDGKISQNNDKTKRIRLSKRQQGMSCTVQDVFNFPSEESPIMEGAVSKDSEVKQSVLKTISKMLEENKALRQRQLILSQVTPKSQHSIAYKASTSRTDT